MNDAVHNLSMWRAPSTIEQIEWRQHRVACPTLESGIHYVELLVDRSPLVHSVEICTRPVYQGDYWLQVTRRKVKNEQGEIINKPLLGVYFPSGDPTEINNDNCELYYKVRSFDLGTDKIDTGMPEKIDKAIEKSVQIFVTKFNLNARITQEGNWFFYGIDSSWRIKKDLILDLDWQDVDNWRLVKKK